MQIPSIRPPVPQRARAGQFIVAWDVAWLYGHSMVFVVTDDEDENFCFHARRVIDPVSHQSSDEGTGEPLPMFASQIIARPYDSLGELLDCAAIPHEFERALRAKFGLIKTDPKQEIGTGSVLVQVRQTSSGD